MSMKLRLGLPSGSLQESTIALFKKAGYQINVAERSYFPSVDDDELECVLLRAQEIPRYVSDGVLDAGLSGKDWIMECQAEVVEVAELVYSKSTTRPICLVIAVAQDSDIRTLADLEGKRIATELVQVTRDFLAQHRISAHVEYSWGATEAKVPELVDAIVELTETGSSLRANKLRILETMLVSTTRLMANPRAWEDEWKRAKLENLAVLLLGALRAEGKVGLKMNVPDAALNDILAMLPAMKQPTVSELVNSPWKAVETIVDEHVARALIPALKRAGAEDIIEYPLNKVIP